MEPCVLAAPPDVPGRRWEMSFDMVRFTDIRVGKIVLPLWRLTRGQLVRRLCLLVFILIGLYDGLAVRRYRIESGKVDTPVRLAFLSDLHSCLYGEDQRDLLRAVDDAKPDVVLLGGDIFDQKLPKKNPVALLRGLAGRYPCYFVTGNHEHWNIDSCDDLRLLERLGVERLDNRSVVFEARGQKIRLCGVDDPFAFIPLPDGPAYKKEVEKVLYDAPSEELAGDSYTVLVVHRPEFFEEYVLAAPDLVLCGHAHGGQWRLPFLINGGYAPQQGFFPKFAGGKYRKRKTTMIVGRGLARESTPAPRFYNPPELVVVDLL